MIWPLWWQKRLCGRRRYRKTLSAGGYTGPGNTAAEGIRCYGAIQDAQALSEGVVASSRYPKHWLTVGDPAREFTMTQSAPLMVLPDPDEFVVVQVK